MQKEKGERKVGNEHQPLKRITESTSVTEGNIMDEFVEIFLELLQYLVIGLYTCVNRRLL
jgi:hypothetical protein